MIIVSPLYQFSFKKFTIEIQKHLLYEDINESRRFLQHFNKIPGLFKGTQKNHIPATET